MKQKVEYKGAEAIKLENKFLSVIIIPAMGGKTASVLYKKRNFELLFQSAADTFAKSEQGDCFASGDACGFDDAFPNIDAETLLFCGNELNYPDHGEIWTA